MSVKDFYSAVDGNYKEVFSQLEDDEVIADFIRKFLSKNEMKKIKDLLSRKKYEKAFICVHNMKGYGLNMAIPILHKPACNLCESIRNGSPTIDIEPLVNDLEKAFNRLQEAESLL